MAVNVSRDRKFLRGFGKWIPQDGEKNKKKGGRVVDWGAESQRSKIGVFKLGVGPLE